MAFKVLIVHYQASPVQRSTVQEHLSAFAKVDGCEAYYLNAFLPLPLNFKNFKFDAIVYHYTLFALRMNGRGHFRKAMSRLAPLRQTSAVQVAMPQDEYADPEILCEFFRTFNVDIVFSCYNERDREIAYPENLRGKVKFYKNLTGYVSDDRIAEISKFAIPHSRRTWDVGYRARKLPFWTGTHGILKWILVPEFLRATKDSSLKSNVSTSENNAFFGDEWYKFLGNCRTVLGCEGGSSLLDFDGRLAARIEKFENENPQASFAQVEAALFPGRDGEIRLHAISPRHFEACLTKTCQVLVEGEYEGIFLPNVHYIPIKKDFSNWPEVINQIRRVDYCENMANRAYEDIIESGRFSYRNFVSEVLRSAGYRETRLDLESRSFAWFDFQSKILGSLIFPVWLLGNIFKIKMYRFLSAFGLEGFWRQFRVRFLGWQDK